MQEARENSQSRGELLWVQLCEDATSAFEDGRNIDAAKCWQDANTIAGEFEDNDPRLAASLNNLGVACRILGLFETAERHYREALERWKSASSWVSEMRFEQRARSSLFHLRLEQKHRAQYNRLALEENQKRLNGGSAGTLNNLAELVYGLKRTEEAQSLFGQALEERSEAMGKEDRGIVTIRKNILNLPEIDVPLQGFESSRDRETRGLNRFSSEAFHHRWWVDSPPEFTDEGRLMAAVLLAHVIDHALIPVMDHNDL
jgi:tetratricopeptide (TPR) repeat protein